MCIEDERSRRNDQKDKSAAAPIRLWRFVAALALSWTVAIALVLAWEVSDECDQAISIAHNEAAGAWRKEAAVYRWAASTGGVWVPVTRDRPANPDLASIADRDVSTSAGRGLTLISPPTIMSEVHARARELSGVQGHVSALHPIRPENAPDPWEKNALEEFARKVPEVDEVEMIDGHRYLRYMRPLLTDASCLTCHIEQRNKVGDGRGGISIPSPWPPSGVRKCPTSSIAWEATVACGCWG